jgi:outer membrane protein OmpA-like peptidoglycan-associated protein
MVMFLILLANFAEVDGSDTQKEFSDELVKVIGQERLDRWGAEVLSDGTLRFKKPENQFDTGKAELKNQFKKDLDEFIPLYLRVMKMPRFVNKIHEIHIDGHTSSVWGSQISERDGYFLNMQLSQQRTVNTLQFFLNNQSITDDYEWFKKKSVANGYSSSRPMVLDASLPINQRVEFKVVIDNPFDTNQSQSKKRKTWTIDIKEN